MSITHESSFTAKGRVGELINQFAYALNICPADLYFYKQVAATLLEEGHLK